jgi:sulfite reductase alpha subunit-like flavoprotein
MHLTVIAARITGTYTNSSKNRTVRHKRAQSQNLLDIIKRLSITCQTYAQFTSNSGFRMFSGSSSMAQVSRTFDLVIVALMVGTIRARSTEERGERYGIASFNMRERQCTQPAVIGSPNAGV